MRIIHLGSAQHQRSNEDASCGQLPIASVWMIFLMLGNSWESEISIRGQQSGQKTCVFID
ncbi:MULTISPECIES: hypothetical protein [Planktothricoides]|uniref:Uncharacterized protein n=2 Tax=Planktothricoides raciborskii TaxID=132608 RepID=A0AAU8JLU8_9CYAN|nr:MULTISPECIES: hypothetical protein [Planktothricoides]KOR33784.1 hypothetical protein AM228_27840 [Planktothricoides sp. SR001]MBD2547011.1 hypothetical protein [Planktothricoides raciborskii FACHB-1370]MBD2581327.1 hypothetical protein [Planktothricoides raciborskii FACHB-1261]